MNIAELYEKIKDLHARDITVYPKRTSPCIQYDLTAVYRTVCINPAS